MSYVAPTAPVDLPEVLDRPLYDGGGAGGETPCVMNAVDARYLIGQGILRAWSLTDLPVCTDVMIARFAQGVNDVMSQDERQALRDEELQVRLMLAHGTDDDLTERRVRVRTLLWVLGTVRHLIEHNKRSLAVWDKSVRLLQDWLDGEPVVPALVRAYDWFNTTQPVPEEDWRAAGAYNTMRGAICIVTQGRSGNTAAPQALYVASDDELQPSGNGPEIVTWLHGLLDAHEKARAEEGVLHEGFGTQGL